MNRQEIISLIQTKASHYGLSLSDTLVNQLKENQSNITDMLDRTSADPLLFEETMIRLIEQDVLDARKKPKRIDLNSLLK